MPPVYSASCCPLFRYSVFVVLLCGIQYPWFVFRGSRVLCVVAASRVYGMAGQGRAEKKKPRGGATNNRIDDKATPGMSEPNCAA